jgi:YbbR domain-containing protein
VPLIIPDGLSTLDEKSENVNNVKVTISIRGKTAYLVLTTKVKVINLSTSFRVQAEASEVSVLLIGPKPLLDEIQKNPELITASLDLDKLTAGAYTIPIQIRIPQGVQAQLFPAEAQVVIQ